jgi:transcription antitermination factor NusG
MPILARELDVHPANLFDRCDLGIESDRGWWCLYTLPRHEKELMRRLRGLDIAFYGPLIARRTRSPGGRMRVSHVPLFPNYAFIYGDGEQRHRAMTTNCVSRWIEVANSQELTLDLRQVRQLIESGAPLTPESRLEPGMPVRIRSGPLAGLEGVTVKRHNQERLVVAVRFLKQGASVLLEDFQVERIS